MGLFEKKKKEENPASKPLGSVMPEHVWKGLPPKPTIEGTVSFDIGYKGSVDDLRARAQKMKKAYDAAGHVHSSGAKVAAEELQMLQAGAQKALSEGRAGNMGAIIFDNSVRECFRRPGAFGGAYVDAKTLGGIIKDSQGNVSDVLTLLLEGRTQEEKDPVLNEALCSAADGYFPSDRVIIFDLLRAGARADTDNNAALRSLVSGREPDEALIKALYDAGASFDDAILYLRMHGRKLEDLDKIAAYRQKITGKGDEITELLKDMKKEMLELREEVKALQAGQNSKPPKLS